MKNKSVSLLSSALVLAATTAAYAQTRPPMITAPANYQPPPSPGLLNEWLRENNPDNQAWDLGGQVRFRYENFDNASQAFPARDFQKTGADNDNDYFILREKLHIGYTGTWFGAYLEGMDSSSSGDKSPVNPGADQIDLHQAYLTLGNAKEFPITAKLGRQEMIYGDERLIGNADWANTTRAFDLAKLRYEDDNRWIDLFSGRQVLIDNHNFNVVDDYDWFSGIYASDKTLLPFQETQLYALARNAAPGTATAGTRPSGPGSPQNSSAGSARDIYTLGTRMKSLPGKLGNWDYTLEAAAQLGSVNLGGRRVEQQAYAGSLNGGYTFKDTTWTPRLAAEYSYSSGDRDPNDDKSQTFDNLFPTNHKHYGYMDYVGWRNIHSPRLSLSAKPTKTLQLSLDWYGFWLVDDRDLFYPQSGAGRSTLGYGRNSAYSKYVGQEIDLDATYAWKSWLVFRGGYGYFIAGDYVKSSKAALGGADNASWFYIQTTFNF